MPVIRPYFEEISRNKPSCIAFLIDQSGSMAEGFGERRGRDLVREPNPTKAQGASDALNRCLANIVMRCTKDEGVRDYFEVGVWGYGATVGVELAGATEGRELIPVSELYEISRIEDRIRQVPDGSGGLISETIKFPVWVDVKADGNTPMCEALEKVRGVIDRWIARHRDSYPPTIINITDGASSDGDPRKVAWQMMELTNNNGSQALVFNIHVSGNSDAPPILYPPTSDGLQSYAKQLFEMSSTLPNKLVVEASMGGLPVGQGSHGFVFNGGLTDLIRFLDIGTRVTTMTDLRSGR
ncbi:MAG: VWA domain-containing protein [Candidatus Latescibacteria bacterium]|nr:VWA domain-containing protein [Candidatus Latescibacterota bacterium]